MLRAISTLAGCEWAQIEAERRAKEPGCVARWVGRQCERAERSQCEPKKSQLSGSHRHWRDRCLACCSPCSCSSVHPRSTRAIKCVLWQNSIIPLRLAPSLLCCDADSHSTRVVCQQKSEVPFSSKFGRKLAKDLELSSALPWNRLKVGTHPDQSHCIPLANFQPVSLADACAIEKSRCSSLARTP